MKIIRFIFAALAEIFFCLFTFGGSAAAIFIASKFLEQKFGWKIFASPFEAYIATIGTFVCLLAVRSEFREREYFENRKSRYLFHGRKEEI